MSDFGVPLFLGLVLVVVLAAWLWSRRRPQAGLGVAPAKDRPSRSSAASGSVQRRNVLVGTDGDVKGKTFHIGMRTVTIGRSSSNFIQTLDEKASRTHCQVRPSIDGLAVKDMDSRNGTLVNDQPIGGPSVLDDGDEIRVGQACFRYHKRLSVAKDAGFERKNVSTVSSRTTMKGAAEDLFSILQTTIDECDGDLARASEELGCDVSTIEALIHQRATGQVDKEMMETKIEGDG